MSNPTVGTPLDQLKLVPAYPPPPGVTPNFDNPEDLGYRSIITTTVFLCVALVFFVARAYVKARIHRRLTWDDGVLLFGFIFAIVYYASNIAQTVNGPLAVHQWNVSVEEITSPRYIVAAYVGSATLNLSLGLIKLSVFLLYLQIFWPLKWMRISIYIGASLSSAFYLAANIFIMYIMAPKNGVSWRTQALSPDETKGELLSVPTGAVGLAIDTCLLVLPIPAVLQTQVSTRRKIGILAIFAVGSLAWIASLVGTYYRVKLQRSQETSWDDMPVEILIQIEMYAGIICVSMPCVSKGLRHHRASIEKARTRFSSVFSLLHGRDRSGVESSGSNSKRPSDVWVLSPQMKSKHYGKGLREASYSGMEDDIARLTRDPTAVKYGV